MKKLWQSGSVVVLALVFAVAMMVLSSTRQAAQGRTAEEGKSTGGPRYMVVETQGHNLLVTDNATNKLYFYTVDKDKPVGSPLKLRASLDLNKVGDKELTITDHGVQR